MTIEIESSAIAEMLEFEARRTNSSVSSAAEDILRWVYLTWNSGRQSAFQERIEQEYSRANGG